MPESRIRYRELTEEQLPEFLARGYAERHVFPHELFFLPACGPDGLKLAKAMCGEADPERLWEIVLYAAGPLVDEFPRELYFDDELVWHQQQYGRPGQVATATLRLAGDTLHSMVHLSDLVQRAARRQEYRTRLQNRFRGWHRMLLNGILNFAVEHGVRAVYTPSAELAMENTDPNRTVQPELYERVYDRGARHHFAVERSGRWWRLDVERNRDRVVVGEQRAMPAASSSGLGIVHYIERGLGHVGIDDELAGRAEATAARHLDEMLRLESAAGVRATYVVVGTLLEEVREQIAEGGHCLAFHSYDHRIGEEQVGRCRSVDYRLKGYCPPQSKVTDELAAERLCHHNFAWLASSRHSLGGLEVPRLRRRLVEIPILRDEFSLYSKGLDYVEWEAGVLEDMASREFTVIGLHDCYGEWWLEHYGRFLDRVSTLDRPRTLDAIAEDVVLSSSG